MKSYPSILGSTGQNFTEFDSFVFDKADGSNLRFEFSKKQGWYKFGTRNRLFGESDEVFGSAIPLFLRELGNDLNVVIRNNRIQHLIVYAEFYGENSFAGNHDPNDEKHLYLFDAAVDKRGLVEPKEFLSLFGDCQTVKFLGKHKWTKSFVEKVRNNELEGVTFEGVVGKAKGKGNTVLMRKAKTQAWIDKVRASYEPKIAESLINS